MRSLEVSIICFAMALIVLSLMSCTTWEEVTPPVGKFEMITTINVQDDWCRMNDGRRANGVILYSLDERSISEICISLKSDDPERTMQHELDHAWRNAVGLDAQARNQ